MLRRTTGYRYAKTNYLGLFSGLNDADGAYSATKQYSTSHYPDPDPRQHAVFCYGKGTPISDITDGTSNTMAVAEYLKGVDSTDARGEFYTNRAGCQTLFVTLGPNSTAPDNLLCFLVSQRRHAERPEHEPALHGLAATATPTTPARAAAIPAA